MKESQKLLAGLLAKPMSEMGYSPESKEGLRVALADRLHSVFEGPCHDEDLVNAIINLIE